MTSWLSGRFLSLNLSDNFFASLCCFNNDWVICFPQYNALLLFSFEQPDLTQRFLVFVFCLRHLRLNMFGNLTQGGLILCLINAFFSNFFYYSRIIWPPHFGHQKENGPMVGYFCPHQATCDEPAKVLGCLFPRIVCHVTLCFLEHCNTMRGNTVHY